VNAYHIERARQLAAERQQPMAICLAGNATQIIALAEVHGRANGDRVLLVVRPNGDIE
jgi:hypothetical protein